MSTSQVKNPYRPGAGHMPPYLAGRVSEQREFARLLDQDPILENAVITGLRGVGKTVFLETLKPIAQHEGWLWVGTDLSESASVDEQTLATRILADLSVITSNIVVAMEDGVGFESTGTPINLTYNSLVQIFERTPGLIADKLKAVLETSHRALVRHGVRGVIFAYDEAQNLSDDPARDQYPLGVLLDVFQSIQRKSIPFMLVLTGLPTLFPRLVESRTYAERMFHVMTLDKLSSDESREAILTPLASMDKEFRFDERSVIAISQHSGGYPYFIQFICREAFDLIVQRMNEGEMPEVPVDGIMRKLDTDFFAGRWAKPTDRQRELLWVIADLRTADGEFTVQEIAERSKQLLAKPFSPSHINQMLAALCQSGLIFKNRWGKYSFAVPMFDGFIRRQKALGQPA